MYSAPNALLSWMGLVVSLTVVAGASQLPLQSTGGCGQPHSGINATRHYSITSGDHDRFFALHLPSNYNANKPTGLILSFHGRGKDMTEQESLSRFSEESINPNMIAVYPQGFMGREGKRAWQGAPYAHAGISDLLFTTDLLSYIRDNYCIDNSQIYAAGKSNGGGFVDTLACSATPGGDFAAFAMASAALYPEAEGVACKPSRASLPILEFHGTIDGTIPYHGCDGEDQYSQCTKELPDIPTWLATWAVRNGCSNPPTPETSDEYGGQVHYTNYTCDDVANIVQGYKTDQQGHWWPSMQPNDDNKGVVAPFEGSKLMMDFFTANPKR